MFSAWHLIFEMENYLFIYEHILLLFFFLASEANQMKMHSIPAKQVVLVDAYGMLISL